MTDDDYAAMTEAMGRLHFETRVALVFLAAAGFDGSITDEQLNDISAYLTTVLEAMGSRYTAGKVMKHALQHYDDKDIKQSIKLLGDHLPKAALASIATHIQKIVDEGDPSEDEQAFVTTLVDQWQVELEAEDDESDDEESDDDEDDESDDEEEPEEE